MISFSTRLAYRLHLLKCSQSYGRVNTDLIPHPNLFFIGKVSETISAPLTLLYELEKLLDFNNLREKADPRYVVPSKMMTEAEFQGTVPHKCIELSKNFVFKAFCEIAEAIEPLLGYHIEIINTRFFALLGSGEDKKYTAKHNDGFPPGVYKVLLYLNGASEELGTTEIFFDKAENPENNSVKLSLPPGSFCLFDSNNLWHRAMMPTNKTARRVTLEYTIGPALKRGTDVPNPGFYAFYPQFPLDTFDLIRNEFEIEKNARH